MMNTKLTNICSVLLQQIFSHSEALGACGLHKARGWWILVKLILGTSFTPSNFRGALSHYNTEKSLPECKADAWISHREQKCPTQCSTRAANEHFISYHRDSVLPQCLKQVKLWVRAYNTTCSLGKLCTSSVGSRTFDPQHTHSNSLSFLPPLSSLWTPASSLLQATHHFHKYFTGSWCSQLQQRRQWSIPRGKNTACKIPELCFKPTFVLSTPTHTI